MRRPIFIVFVIALVLVAILALSGSCEVRDGNAVFAQEVTPERYPVAILYSDGSWEWIATPEPTSTPIVDTSTPSPTASTPPTNTAQPSATVTRTPITPFYTPTPETTMQPTWTPSTTPTIAPTTTPQPVGCWGTVNVPALNVRDAPYGNRLGQVFAGDTLAFDAKWQDVNNDWWWRFWWDTEGVTAWVASWLILPGDTADCSELPDVTPITFAPRAGCHILMGEGSSACQPFAANITAAKCLPGSYHICLYMKAANPDMWIVARPFTDCVAKDYDYDAWMVWQSVKTSIPPGYDALELENECAPERDNIEGWEGWSGFNIDMATIVEMETGMQYLAFGFGPGWPEYYLLHYIVPYLEWVEANPLADGRYHGVASHAAVFAPWSRPDMPWVNEPHIAGRVYKMREVMLAEGFDLATWSGIWAYTEWGLSDGYSGNWGAAYTCEEAASAYKESQRVAAEYGYPDVFLWWNFGQIGMWTSDHACAAAMFG